MPETAGVERERENAKAEPMCVTPLWKVLRTAATIPRRHPHDRNRSNDAWRRERSHSHRAVHAAFQSEMNQRRDKRYHCGLVHPTCRHPRSTKGIRSQQAQCACYRRPCGKCAAVPAALNKSTWCINACAGACGSTSVTYSSVTTPPRPAQRPRHNTTPVRKDAADSPGHIDHVPWAGSTGNRLVRNRATSKKPKYTDNRRIAATKANHTRSNPTFRAAALAPAAFEPGAVPPVASARPAASAAAMSDLPSLAAPAAPAWRRPPSRCRIGSTPQRDPATVEAYWSRGTGVAATPTGFRQSFRSSSLRQPSQPWQIARFCVGTTHLPLNSYWTMFTWTWVLAGPMRRQR